jgi:transketolase
METCKGNGVPDFEGRLESHYLPLTELQYQAAMARLGGET